jgi:hypothetical protein
MRRRLLSTGVSFLTGIEVPHHDPWAVREIPVVSRLRERVTLNLERAGVFTEVDEPAEDGAGTRPATSAAASEALPAPEPRRSRRELGRRSAVLRDDPRWSRYTDERGPQ